MALQPYDGELSSKSKKASTVLHEEKYTENLERIIKRDFFPDYDKVKDHKDYLEAEEKKDFEKMRQITLKYARGAKPERDSTGNMSVSSAMPFPSPATFETPVVDAERLGCPKEKSGSRNYTEDIKNENLGYQKKDIEATVEGEVKKSDAGDSLNVFLSKYTSEDNESFETIMEKTDQAQREKHAWLYEAERVHAEKNRKMLMLEQETSDQGQLLAIESSGKTEQEDDKKEGSSPEETQKPSRIMMQDSDDRLSKTVDTWTYKAKNHLMYYPEGVENQDDLFKKPYEIVHANTRFQKDPFKDALDRSKLAEAAAENAKFSVGERVGHDGKAILPQASPSVNGFGFVATPSPAPGVNMSPIMTWGVIDGTPARLDGSNTPTPGPSFRFPKESRRDELTYKMVDENTKKKRTKKEAALRQVKESVLAGTPRRVGSIMSSERINTLSPAARRLVNKKLGIGTDKRLKQSYTPTPSSRTSCGSLTPIPKTPTPRSRGRQTPQASPANTSITDNLLNIPSKKPRASDFF